MSQFIVFASKGSGAGFFLAKNVFIQQFAKMMNTKRKWKEIQYMFPRPFRKHRVVPVAT